MKVEGKEEAIWGSELPEDGWHVAVFDTGIDFWEGKKKDKAGR